MKAFHLRAGSKPLSEIAAIKAEPEALRLIGELYEIEETIRGKPPDERREVRQQRA